MSKYAFHRIRRIYPPYVATLALAVGLAAFAGSKIAAHLNGVTEPVRLRSVVTALTLTESHYCATFWSLVVEAQWYFLVPVLALLWKWSRWAMHSGMLASIAAATLLSPLAPKYHLSLLQLGLLAIYLPLFWLGIVLAEIAAGYGQWARTFLQRGGWLIVLLTGYVAIHHYAPPEAVWGQSRAQAFPFGLFYSGILAAALFTGAGQRLFSSSLAVKAGAFSYSLYLIHGLIVYIAIVAMAHYHIDGWRELVICLSVLPAVCIASGYLFYLAVEKRTLRARASNESFVRTAAQPKEFAPVV